MIFIKTGSNFMKMNSNGKTTKLMMLKQFKMKSILLKITKIKSVMQLQVQNSENMILKMKDIL